MYASQRLWYIEYCDGASDGDDFDANELLQAQ